MSEDSRVSWAAALAPVPAWLERDLPNRWAACEFLPSVDSTNRWLLDVPDLHVDRYHVCVAREQTAGRGRRGRSWLSAPDSGLTFSLGRGLDPLQRPAPALSLAVGVGVARGLSRLGLHGFGVKWPNDLVTQQGGKLAGILIEARTAGEGRPPALVAGVGLNRSHAGALGLDRAVADLTDLPGGNALPALPDLLHALLIETARAWDAFVLHGLASVFDDYMRLDQLLGRRVRVIDSGSEGIAAGIDPADGALLLRRPDGVERLHAGDLSVRWVDDD